MKIFRLTILLNLIFLLASCGTVKEGFKNPKKNSSDEFLVEKKSPLVMPPEHKKLPIPKTEQNKEKLENEEIKLLITSNKKKKVSDVSKTELNKTFEESILEKIKNN